MNPWWVKPVWYPHRRMQRRRGSTYFMVVSIALLAGTISLGSLALSTAQRRQSAITRDMAHADLLVRSAVEYGMNEIDNQGKWRTGFQAYQNGVLSGRLTVGTGKLAWTLVDPVDQDITDDPRDPVWIIGQGEAGYSTRRYGVLAFPQGRPLEALKCAVHCTRKLSVNDDLTAGIGPLSSDTEIDVGDNLVYAQLESPHISRSSNLVGAAIKKGAAKPIPDATVFQAYATMANEFDYASLPGGRIDSTIISSTRNPDAASPANAWGIYQVRVPAGSDLAISNTQITGTLLVELTGDHSTLTVSEGVVWTSADDHFPALIVLAHSDVGTTVTLGSRGTYSRVDTVDPLPVGGQITPIGFRRRVVQLPGELNGLYHVIRTASKPSSVTKLKATNPFRGCLLADGPVKIQGRSRLVSRPELLSAPPLGYGSGFTGTNWIQDGDFEQSSGIWLPVGSNELGVGTRLARVTDAGSLCLQVEQRKTASDGVAYDVTSWLASGEELDLKFRARMAGSREQLRVTLEWVSDVDGMQRRSALFDIDKTWTAATTSVTPVWNGALQRARLIFTTTTSNQTFLLDDVVIPNLRTTDASRLEIVPTTWRPVSW